jgi:uncharacterized protein HemX
MKNKKKVAVVTVAGLGLGLLGFGGGALAESFWAGHTNIVQINSDIDTLTARLKSKQTKIDDLTSQLAQAKSDLSTAQSAQTGLNNQLASLQNQYTAPKRYGRSQLTTTDSRKNSRNTTSYC